MRDVLLGYAYPVILHGGRNKAVAVVCRKLDASAVVRILYCVGDHIDEYLFYPLTVAADLRHSVSDLQCEIVVVLLGFQQRSVVNVLQGLFK